MSKATVLPILPAGPLGPPDPALERDTEELYQALSDLVHLYESRDRDRICCYDISVTQYYALEALVRRGGMTLNDLAASSVSTRARRAGWWTPWSARATWPA